MAGGGNDIVIKGGSVEVEFDQTIYTKTPDPSVYKCTDRKITRIVITGEINFDSGEHPEGLRCEVRATTGPTISSK